VRVLPWDWPLPVEVAGAGAAAAAALRPREPLVRRERLAPFPLLLAAREDPAMPCACLRCAPSAAARLNVRPHSGHVNSVLGV
jgi:hypothetical protein